MYERETPMDILDVFEKLQKPDPEKIRRVWQIVKHGDPDQLPREERQLAGLMIDHPELNIEFLSGSVTTAFLHVQLHQIVQGQLESREPVEVFQFFNNVRKKGLDSHQTVDLIIAVFGGLIAQAQEEKKSFNYARYKNLLKRGKDKKLLKLQGYLKRELNL